MELLPGLIERERIAEDLLTSKQLIVDLDRKRNTNREALTAIRKAVPANQTKLWVNFGDMFVKLEKVKVQGLIEKDQKLLEKEITTSQDTVKQKTAELERLEMGTNEKMAGFDLKGITANDLYNITGKQQDFRR